MKKKVAVLGATGSIGKSTMDVLRDLKDCFQPVLLTAHSDAKGLLELKKEFPAALTALADHRAAEGTQFDFSGRDGLLRAIAEAKANIVVNGISGAAGLEPSVAAINAGSDLALANKETIVMAGRIISALAKEKKVRVNTVDSEHSAISKLIEAHGKDNISEIILTASGGPFRKYSQEKLSRVTLKEALTHPTWNMGPKITVDSATLANKGLEVIEAAGLFGFPSEKIKVAIHPQSVVHSMVRLKDGAVYAQMTEPDMRLPIHQALTWPKTVYSPFGVLDLISLSLTFKKPDLKKFPMLDLAYRSLSGGEFLSIAYNAANETVVEAFLKEKISFLEIPRIVKYVLDESVNSGESLESVEAILKADREARKMAEDFIARRSDEACAKVSFPMTERGGGQKKDLTLRIRRQISAGAGLALRGSNTVCLE
jgi:1-deoxy-D-xylulose-5-phosphate reductoisomerase